MWTRAELKDRAKAALKNGYWKLVLVGFIASVVSGGGGSGSSSEDSETITSGFGAGFGAELLAVLPIVIAVAAVIIIIAVAVSIFLFHPIEVGTKRFFIKSLTEDTQVKEISYAFDHGYKNVVKTMFWMNLKIFLWSLLFVIPGIVKAYEYRMIPFLLAENPYMDKEEAFRLSRQMMYEQKWNAFVLDLSFLGWEILSAFTLGLVGIFYVQPYVYLTDAALYDTLSAAHGHPAGATASQQEWNSTYTEYEEI